MSRPVRPGQPRGDRA